MRDTNGNETLLLEPASRLETPPAASPREKRRGMGFDDYEVGGFYDEMFVREGEPRAVARRLLASIESLPEGEMLNRQQAAERELLQMGITFNVYGEHARRGEDFPVRHRAEDRRGGRMEADRARAQAAHPGAEPFH